MKKDTYIYPAVFDYADDGISVSFPDLPGCFTCGETTEEAMLNAREAMGLYLHDMEDTEDLPMPSEPLTVAKEKSQVIVIVDVFMPVIRKAIENQSVQRCITLPKWLDDLAKTKKINVSAVTKNALEKELLPNG